MFRETLDIDLVVSLASMLLVIILIFISLIIFFISKKRLQFWKNKYLNLSRKNDKTVSILESYDGLTIIWEDYIPDIQKGWGRPKHYGSLEFFSEINVQEILNTRNDMVIEFLDFIADLTVSGTNGADETLRINIAKLSKSGLPFSIDISLSDNLVVKADGRVAGNQIVIWLNKNKNYLIDLESSQKSNTDSTNHLNSTTSEFSEILGRSPFPKWRMTGTGNITWVNAAYVDAVGGSSSNSVIEQQNHLDNRVIDQGKKALETNKSFTNVRNIILHGNNKPTSITTYPVSGGVAGIALDVTEVEILKRNLSTYKTAHQKILNKMDEAIVIFEPDQKISFYNSSFSTLCSLDNEWFKNSPTHGSWLDHMNEKNLIPAQSDYVSWKNSELALYSVWPEEMPDEIWSLPDGKILRLVRMRDLHGGVSLLFSDMTDSIKLKTELGKLINVQKATLDKLSEGIAVFGTDGRLRIHNASFATIWNFSEDDLENTPRFSDLINLCLPLYNNPDFWNSLRARATNPNPQIRHHDSGEIIRSDNRIFTWLSRPLPDGATLLAWEDVTSARKAQAALIERAEALEEADRMKSEFVGHVSYQLRTPLTTISGYSEFLQNNGAGEITDKQSEYIFAIQSASEDLSKTINDILDIAAIEANVLDLELSDIEIHKILEHSLDYVATKAEDTKISLSLKSHSKVGKIRGDEVKLKQVVYNLLTNALRFTKPGGVIELGGKKADGGGVIIWVKDNGVGIPTDLQPQVFSSFKSSRGGSGLGLALVQRFVERHGGWVELESEEEVGTCVSIYLPREAPEDQSHAELFNKTA